MTDLLLDLSRYPVARRAIRRLGLPLPLPTVLRRATGPWRERPLEGRTFACAPGALGDLLESTVADAGARPARPAEAPDLLLLDATGFERPSELRGLYEFFHPRIRGLRPCGRILVVGRDPERLKDPGQMGTQAAIEGFVRSVAKEVGRKGATAHLVRLTPRAEARLAPLLRFLLSDRAAFLTGQVWSLSTRVRASKPRLVRPLEGKVALVTGAARGVGAATARALAREGARVLCLDRPADADLAAEVVRGLDGEVLEVDLAAPDAAALVAGLVAARSSALDVVVHNAGITRDRTLGKMSSAEWDQVMAVNLKAVIEVTEALLDADLLAGGARLVALSSVAGLAGNAGQTNYAASKAGVAGYVRGLAARLATNGIAVNAVAPGFIETRLTDAIPLVQREAARRLSALGQGGLPEDIAELVTFLASPGASGLSGQVIRACGGMFVGA